MPDFSPFCGYRFSSALDARISRILSPPYDKISRKELPSLWEADPLNCSRLVLPPPDVAEGDFATESAAKVSDWYAGSRRFLDNWIQEGFLVQDPLSFYFYCQEFLLDGKSYQRWGVLGALSLEDNRKTLLHERTFEGPKADRFRLIRETQANLCSIFLVATDPDRELLSIATNLDHPQLDCATPDGVRHKLHIVSDKETIERTRNALMNSTVMIADGHHRFETALNYRAWAAENLEENRQSPSNHVMAYVSPVDQEGMIVLPTHRLVRNLGDNWLDTLNRATNIVLREIHGSANELLHELRKMPETDVVLGATDGDQFHLVIRRREPSAEMYPDIHPALWNLDVTFLHSMVLRGILRVDESRSGAISYFRDPQEATTAAAEDPGSGVFFLRAPNPQTIMKVSESGERMPQKSTDFYPKIPTGLVIRLLREPPSL
ncbi:MAG TPA: DUF1015 domain-containing protein [bacterium]|nr:DUF1015 domain-containing protein [bacterium]HQO35533.1 DUF1015 domain-containing protein [bacterium]HQP99390.1 DUF1015 domain-containing protein [bacterium]